MIIDVVIDVVIDAVIDVINAETRARREPNCQVHFKYCKSESDGQKVMLNVNGKGNTISSWSRIKINRP